ncbi:MAG: metallophosphoesterase [Kofleriaceae bacterium]|nr:metallophosphoesterase [Kofleriaceae bacterium]
MLVAAGSRWDVALAIAPRATHQLAAVVLGDVDVAAGRRAAGTSIFGDPDAAAPPPAWPLANRDDAVEAAAPLALGDAKRCDCATRLGDLATIGDADRVAALWATTRFAVTAAQRDLEVLDVRARYGDGIVVWLNGVEVARRRVAPAARPGEMAGMVRGPEWETFHVPVAPGLLRLGDNLVAVEVRPSGRSVAPRFDLELVGRRGAALTRGPVLQRVGLDHASILIETDLPTTATVEWGPTEALGHEVASPAGIARRHVIDLDGLPAAGVVHYRVLAAGATTPVRTFRTLPARGQVVRVAVYGDVRGGHETHAELVAAIRAEDPDLVLATGDLVLRGSDEGDWDRFFAVAGELLATIPFVAAPGNHDLGRTGDARRRFADIFALPALPADDRPAWAVWYGFDAGDVHVAVIDSNAYDEAAQRTWLDADLAAAEAAGARTILVMMHDGPYSRGSHGGNREAAETYVPIMARHHATLVLSGHDHLYQRGRQGGVDYLVTGGGGAPLYAISCGVKGKRRCKVDDGMRAVLKEHHYVMLNIYPDFVEACAKRADGTALEPCVTYRK